MAVTLHEDLRTFVVGFHNGVIVFCEVRDEVEKFNALALRQTIYSVRKELRPKK
jgi:hypothetical protein